LLNNREIATVFWLALFAILMLSKPGVRKAMAAVIRCFLNWKILACFGAMILYTVAVVAGLYAIGFWQVAMMKDTAMWFCFTAFAMVLRFTNSSADESVLRHVVSDNVTLIILLEFVIGTYVMSLPIELALVPLTAFLVMVDAVARNDIKSAPIAKFTAFVLCVVGTAILGFAVSTAIIDYRNVGTLDTLRSIAFPPLMSIIFVPFVYFLLVIATYESIFTRLTFGREKAPDVVRYAKRRILVHCGVSLGRLRSLTRRQPLEIMSIKSGDDVDRLLR
jgi:hypothetical protein